MKLTEITNSISGLNNTPIMASPFPFTVASQTDVPTLQFPGVIDDILVYDRVLTGPEIVDIFSVLSIEDIDAFSSQVKVYPNPTSATISIDYNNSLGTVTSYSITDIQGRIIVDDIFEGSKTTIDLYSIESGIYLLRLLTNDGISISKKIIKN